jgi:hypothetical protein
VKTHARQPAQIDFGADPGSPPRSPLYGDIYHPRIGALAQARHVFLHGNGLPARWAGRRDFVGAGDRLRPGQQLSGHLGCLAARPGSAASACTTWRWNCIHPLRPT